MSNVPKHNPKQVEFVEQQKKTDCGIACVAMLTNRLYSEIIGIFPELKRRRGGLYPDDIFEVLDELGYSYREMKRLPRRGPALVAIEWKDPSLSGHYIVWDSKRRKFLDPLNGVMGKREMLKYAKIEYIWRINKLGQDD